MKIDQFRYEDLPYLSKRDRSYLSSDPRLDEFISYPAQIEAFKDAINDRKQYPVDRGLLASELEKQYKQVKNADASLDNINKLKQDNCFTIITAHQPSLFTGPLYYIFKILSVIQLCKQLTQAYPQNEFIPVFISGGEDHDFEEVNHINLYRKSIVWGHESGGAVGRFDLENITTAISELEEILGQNSKAKSLTNKLSTFANEANNYAAFNFKLVHALFGEFGLVYASMDNVAFKRASIPLLKQEIFERVSKSLVQNTQQNITKLGFDAQTHMRDINVFYLSKNRRSRIEYSEDKYKIVDTELQFTESELLEELNNKPEQFSPNVIMRPIYQEHIFPNLAYIGGGGELAYWMERKAQFKHFKTFFPMLVRRKSAMLISHSQAKQIGKSGLSIIDLFPDVDSIIKTYISKDGDAKLADVETESKTIESIFAKLADRASTLDPTLKNFVLAEGVKQQKSLDNISKKIEKRIKEKNDIDLKRIQKLKLGLFPNNGLQERYENIFPWLAIYGTQLIQKMAPHFDALDKRYMVICLEEQDLEQTT